MQFDILTIFPKIINDYVGESILKRAVAGGKIKIIAHDFRKFATDKHHKVDDKPYGGGPGMVFKVEPIFKALQKIVGPGLVPGRGFRSACHMLDKKPIPFFRWDATG